MAKQYRRKAEVAGRYRVTPRTVDRMVGDKRLPPPVYLGGGRIPLWDEEQLDEADRAATAAPRSKHAHATA
jgi:hypothetical protein